MSFYFSARYLLIGLCYYFTHGHTRLLWLPPQLWIGPMLPAINFLLALGIQSALIYIIPLLVFENCSFLRAFLRSFLIFKRLFVPTVLLISAAAHPNFDYIALGHIHRKQVLNENPPMIYSGSLERLEFSDENEEKGFYIIDIDFVESYIKGRQ